MHNKFLFRVTNLVIAYLFLTTTSQAQNNIPNNTQQTPKPANTSTTTQPQHLNPNASYDGISERWGETSQDQADPIFRPDYLLPTRQGFNQIPGIVRVKYGVDIAYDKITFTDKPTLGQIFPGGKAFDPVLPNPATDQNGNPLPPIGLRFPTVFDSDNTVFNSFYEFGTQGLFSEHLSTFCSIIQQRSINDVADGSPFLGQLQTFGIRTTSPGNIQEGNRLQVTNAYGRISNLGNENFNLGFKFGRQQSAFTYGLTAAATFDGLTTTFQGKDFNALFYVGARHSFFAQPKERFLTGLSLTAQLPYKLNVEYALNYYKVARHLLRVTRSLYGFNLGSYLTIRDDEITDYGATAVYISQNGKAYLKASYDRQVSSNDFVFDQFVDSNYTGFLVDKNMPLETVRLYLRTPRESTTVTTTGEYFVTSWLGLGLDYVHHMLSENQEEAFDPLTNTSFPIGQSTPFDAPYIEGAGFIDIIPKRILNLFSPRFNIEFRQRSIRRGDFRPVAFMPDTQGSGETKYREIVAQAHLPINSRLSTDFTFYRRSYDFRNRTQNRLTTSVTDSSAISISTGVNIRLNQINSIRAQYGFDTDFAEYNPDIKNAHQLRVSYRLQF